MAEYSKTIDAARFCELIADEVKTSAENLRGLHLGGGRVRVVWTAEQKKSPECPSESDQGTGDAESD